MKCNGAIHINEIAKYNRQRCLELETIQVEQRRLENMAMRKET